MEINSDNSTYSKVVAGLGDWAGLEIDCTFSVAIAGPRFDEVMVVGVTNTKES